MLLVAFFMGLHAQLYHQYEEFLEVDGFIAIDIQFSEPGVCILFLSRLRRKKQSVNISVKDEEWTFTWDSRWISGPGASTEPGREPDYTQPILTFKY